ncbi:MAG: hypothetical protein RIB80_04740 [Rhodospirillales bacterium]
MPDETVEVTDVNAERTHANVAHRQEQITKAMRDILDLEQRIDELKAEHIKPLQNDIKTIKQSTIKGDLGLKLKAFNWQYKGFKMEQDAKRFDDEAERDTLLDSLRECHEATVRGQMVDFVDVLQQVQAAE